MDSDDDYEVFAHTERPSPPLAAPKMRRLKKLTHALNETLIDQVVAVSVNKLPPLSGSAENRSENESGDASIFEDTALGFESVDDGREVEMGDLDLGKSDTGNLTGVNENSNRELGAKRALDFHCWDGEAGEGNSGKEDLVIDGSEKQSDAYQGNEKDRTKKRKKRSEGDGEDLEISRAVSKKRSEKERREYLNQLHAESQRLLRETRYAGFQPAPAVHKPLSSVLEKIRKRKLELQMRTVNSSITYNVIDDDDDGDIQFSEGVTILKSDSIPLGGVDAGLSKPVNGGAEDTLEAEQGFNEAFLDRNEDSLSKQNLDNIGFLRVTNEERTGSLRSPIFDTQDLLFGSEASDSKKERSNKNGEDDSQLEEKFVPSVLAMNLRFDSTPYDDECSDEEENDKENVGCHQPMPTGDPVQAFVDDEAMEEDDGDNDQLRFQENEDDDDFGEDANEINGMIAFNYEESRKDQEKRLQLHMKMLERQDAEGIDNLLQKYKFGPKLNEVNGPGVKDSMFEDEDESFNKALGTEAPKYSLRFCAKKAKQMIVHMFTDDEDVYASSEDEDFETSVVNRVFRDTDKEKKLIQPVEDDSSREIFGLIKKLNIAPEMKKSKTSSFDMITSKSASSSKPSFLGRALSNSLPSSRQQHGSSVTRAFVFARGDSNSRSSVSVSEETDTVQKEVQPSSRSTAKFSQSQKKQKPMDLSETGSNGSSLFDILRHSTLLQHNQVSEEGRIPPHHNKDSKKGKIESVFASFKLPKRSKIDRML